MMRPRSSWLAISRSYHLRRTMLRSLTVLLRQAGQAALAAAMAASACWGPRLATSASVAPVLGSCTSKRAGPLTHSPLISASVLSRLGSLSRPRGAVFMSMAGLQFALEEGACAFFQRFNMCEKARPSRILLTRGTTLHVVSRGPRSDFVRL